jgi:hypothetical protein
MASPVASQMEPNQRAGLREPLAAHDTLQRPSLERCPRLAVVHLLSDVMELSARGRVRAREQNYRCQGSQYRPHLPRSGTRRPIRAEGKL